MILFIFMHLAFFVCIHKGDLKTASIMLSALQNFYFLRPKMIPSCNKGKPTSTSLPFRGSPRVIINNNASCRGGTVISPDAKWIG